MPRNLSRGLIDRISSIVADYKIRNPASGPVIWTGLPNSHGNVQAWDSDLCEWLWACAYVTSAELGVQRIQTYLNASQDFRRKT